MSNQKLAAIGAVRPRLFMFPLFILHARQALAAAKASQGCSFAGTHFRRGLAFSLTVWDSPADMKRYAHGQGHARAMRWSRLTSQISYFHHFTVTTRPSWDEAIARWEAHAPLVAAPKLGHKRVF